MLLKNADKRIEHRIANKNLKLDSFSAKSLRFSFISEKEEVTDEGNTSSRNSFKLPRKNTI